MEPFHAHNAFANSRLPRGGDALREGCTMHMNCTSSCFVCFPPSSWLFFVVSFLPLAHQLLSSRISRSKFHLSHHLSIALWAKEHHWELGSRVRFLAELFLNQSSFQLNFWVAFLRQGGVQGDDLFEQHRSFSVWWPCSCWIKQQVWARCCSETGKTSPDRQHNSTQQASLQNDTPTMTQNSDGLRMI